MVARRVTAGVWERIHPGVFAVVGAPMSWHRRLLAVCLWAGDGAAVSHLTAARLYGLEGVPAPRRSEAIEITVPFGQRRRAPGCRFHQSRGFDKADRAIVDAIPVTTLARTLVDLSMTLDDERLAVALDSGLARSPAADIRRLRREVRRLQTQGRAGPRALTRLLELRAPGANALDSALERRFRGALLATDLPKPAEHYDVVDGGRHLAELDFAYPDARLGIQLQGASVHRRYSKWQRDQEQLSELAAAGWRVIQITWAQLDADQSAVLDRIARGLG